MPKSVCVTVMVAATAPSAASRSNAIGRVLPPIVRSPCTRPLAFDLVVGDGGRVAGTAVVKQTDFGMKPYSTLFGALKVADEVRVKIDAALPQSR